MPPSPHVAHVESGEAPRLPFFPIRQLMPPSLLPFPPLPPPISRDEEEPEHEPDVNNYQLSEMSSSSGVEDHYEDDSDIDLSEGERYDDESDAYDDGWEDIYDDGWNNWYINDFRGPRYPGPIFMQFCLDHDELTPHPPLPPPPHPPPPPPPPPPRPPPPPPTETGESEAGFWDKLD